MPMLLLIPVGFDAMGLTDNENPIGLMPFLTPGVGILSGRKRKKRSKGEEGIFPEPKMDPKGIHGGER